ncbi:hypothetical protein GCM10009535_57140 [Streptomyces thermocarboxydovorans]|uniref:Uncharacterized protein n=1 Tax=Streptomyces thermocarboxydovorans TaxID=59298 RepID=A0ABP3T2D1_9ACTN
MAHPRLCEGEIPLAHNHDVAAVQRGPYDRLRRPGPVLDVHCVRPMELCHMYGQRTQWARVVADQDGMRPEGGKDAVQPCLRPHDGSPRRLGAPAACLQKNGHEADQSGQLNLVLADSNDAAIVLRPQPVHAAAKVEETGRRRAQVHTRDARSRAPLRRVGRQVHHEAGAPVPG